MTAMKGRIELSDPDASEDLRLDFDGIHFISNGSIYAFAETVYVTVLHRALAMLTLRHSQSRDIRTLPLLVPESRRNDTARVIEAELSARMARLKEKIEMGSIDQDALNDPGTPSATLQCVGPTYVQQMNRRRLGARSDSMGILLPLRYRGT